MVIEYLAAFSGIAGAFKSATDLTKAISDLTDDTAIKAKTVELQAQILAAQNMALTAQTTQFTLLDEKRALEAKIAEMEAWGSQKIRYKLCSVGTGSVVYALLESQSNGDPPHWLCPQCYAHGKPGFLQKTGLNTGGRPDHFPHECMECGRSVRVPWSARPRYAEQETQHEHPA